MPPPNEARGHFPDGVFVSMGPIGVVPSTDLVRLLVNARGAYDWPAGTGAAASQARIIALEASVADLLGNFTPQSAHQIVVDVSDWAGNNAAAHRILLGANPAQIAVMHGAIRRLLNAETVRAGLDDLSGLPGLSLVVSSKIYRFCCPLIGAAVDRHASYFFNSLPTSDGEFSTQFHRQWSNGRGGTTRLATYNAAALLRNTNEYFSNYLPLLRGISDYLNAFGHGFICASTGAHRDWAPADVEMAAYYWWAMHGAR